MFVRGLKSLKGRGMSGLGEFVNVPRKVEYWLPQVGGAAASVIPGVSNTTAAVAAGGLGLLAAAAAAYYFLKK